VIRDQHDAERRRPVAQPVDERRAGPRLREYRECRNGNGRRRSHADRTRYRDACAMQDQKKRRRKGGRNNRSGEQMGHEPCSGLGSGIGSKPST